MSLRGPGDHPETEKNGNSFFDPLSIFDTLFFFIFSIHFPAPKNCFLFCSIHFRVFETVFHLSIHFHFMNKTCFFFIFLFPCLLLLCCVFLGSLLCVGVLVSNPQPPHRSGHGVLWVWTITHPCDDPPRHDGEASERQLLLACLLVWWLLLS